MGIPTSCLMPMNLKKRIVSRAVSKSVRKKVMPVMSSEITKKKKKPITKPKAMPYFCFSTFLKKLAISFLKELQTQL